MSGAPWSPEPLDGAAGLEGMLGFLVRGLCQEAGVGVRLVDEEEGGWAFCPRTREVQVPRSDLRTRGVSYCVSIVGHECGHQMISRYHLFRFPFPDATCGQGLLNALEDPRVDHYAGLRFPGVAADVRRRQVTEHRELRDRDDLRNLPLFGQFTLLASVDTPGRDALGAVRRGTLDPRVVVALQRTRAARHELLRLVPAVHAAAPDRADEASLVAEYESMQDDLRAAAVGTGRPPGWREVDVLVQAHRAHRVVVAEIAPVARELYELDRAERRDPSLGQVRGRVRARRSGRLARSASARRRRLLREAGIPHWPGRGEASSGSGDGAHRAAGARAYAEALRRVGGLVRPTVRTLQRVLEPARPHDAWRHGVARGPRIHLPAAMRCEVDRRAAARVFSRRAPDATPDPAVLVLVDLSGSMAGEKVSAALDGTVLLAEVLERMRVPFAVYGFQDRLVEFLPFGARLGPTSRRALGEMPAEAVGERPGGHNEPGANDDGPCLLEAAGKLMSVQRPQRLLFVISDGQPAGVRSDEADLKQAVERIGRLPIRLIGLGIGPGTGHVAEYYPVHHADLGLETFPSALGALVVEGVRGVRVAATRPSPVEAPALPDRGPGSDGDDAGIPF